MKGIVLLVSLVLAQSSFALGLGGFGGLHLNGANKPKVKPQIKEIRQKKKIRSIAHVEVKKAMKKKK